MNTVCQFCEGKGGWMGSVLCFKEEKMSKKVLLLLKFDLFCGSVLCVFFLCAQSLSVFM